MSNKKAHDKFLLFAIFLSLIFNQKYLAHFFPQQFIA